MSIIVIDANNASYVSPLPPPNSPLLAHYKSPKPSAYSCSFTVVVLIVEFIFRQLAGVGFKWREIIKMKF